MMLLFITCIVVLSIALIKLILKATINQCNCSNCLIGKTAIITGGNSGLGYHTALQLAGRGCKLIIADVQDGTDAVKNIIQETNNSNVYYKHLDLSSFESIRNFANDINRNENRLDLLLNNAGIGASQQEEATIDGLNPIVQINYLGPFLLTHLLVDLLKKTDESRIIFVSSVLAHINNLTLKYFENRHVSKTILQYYIEYGNTKTLNIIAAKIFADKLNKYNIKTFSINPGMTYTQMHENTFNVLNRKFNIPTSLNRLFSRTFSQTVNEGIQSLLHAALSKSILKHSGKFWANCQLAYMPRNTRNEQFCMEMWKLSEKYANLADNEKIQ